jgi:D-alanine-D-alanine ligase
MRVALTFNLKPEAPYSPSRPDYYAEWDDQSTIDAVASALGGSHTILKIALDRNIVEKLKSARPDIVFNVAEGINSPNRESQIPVICEMLGIPYTGSDGFTLAACLNKARAKEIMSFHKIPTPAFQVITSPDQSLNGLRLPLIVKPLWEGSSMGVKNDSIAFNRDEVSSRLERVLDEYRQPALVESYLNGREFTAALIGNGDTLRVLPLVEIDFGTLPQGARPIYSYEAKWIWDKPENPLKIFSCPAELDEPLRRRIEQVCKRAFFALGCRDWCRVDVRLDDTGMPNVLELNPLPGILPDPKENSCFPKAAMAAGMSYAELINKILRTAYTRYRLKGTAARCHA